MKKNAKKVSYHDLQRVISLQLIGLAGIGASFRSQLVVFVINLTTVGVEIKLKFLLISYNLLRMGYLLWPKGPFHMCAASHLIWAALRSFPATRYSRTYRPAIRTKVLSEKFKLLKFS